MHEDLEKLIVVQHTEQAIQRMEAELKSLPVKLAAIEAKLTAARTALTQTDAKLKAEEIARRGQESDVRDLQLKITKYRGQLDSVQNNDQYKALLHEISFAEQAISAIEDKELESMERTEQLTAARKALEEELFDQTATMQREQERAKETAKRDEAAVKNLRELLKQVRAEVGEETLSIYDRIAKARKTGLAEAWNAQCSACQMTVRPQKWSEIRTGLQMTCESCGRLLYYDLGHGTDAAKEALAEKRIAERSA
jgi:predicted  nucleic acid-binding Zn-ribbon protein